MSNNATQPGNDERDLSYYQDNETHAIEVECKACLWNGFTEDVVIVADGLEWIATCPNCGNSKLNYL